MKLMCQRFAPCLVDSVGLALQSEERRRGEVTKEQQKKNVQD